MNKYRIKFIFILITSLFLTLGISISFQSLLADFTAPLNNPPTCTSGNPGCDFPINEGSSNQSKNGSLILNTDGNASGLIVQSGMAGIGTSLPIETLHVEGSAYFSGAVIDDSASGKNLIPNWQMESDTFWTDALEQTIVSDFNNVNHYAQDSSETGTGCYNWAHTALIPADPNKLYKFSIWIRSTDTSMNNYFGFHLYNSSKARVTGDWNNLYFKTNDGDSSSWKKWTAYLGPSYAGGATGCDSSKTNANDYCLSSDTAFIKMRFGSCYGDGGSNGHSYFMYPKIEEIDPDDGWITGDFVVMDGQIGIKNSTPSYDLDVYGDIRAGSNGAGNLFLGNRGYYIGDDLSGSDIQTNAPNIYVYDTAWKRLIREGDTISSIDLDGWTFDDNYFYDDGEEVIRASDEWLRLNQSNHFTSGTFTPYLMRADGGYQVDGNQVIDANAGWHRSYGSTGWLNSTYGGGWYMSDSTWIRSYGSKNVYVNTMLRADGGLQVGDDEGFARSAEDIIRTLGDSLNVENNLSVTNDTYLGDNKSIRVDSSGNTTLLLGNYYSGGFTYGTSPTASIAVEGDVKGNRLCLQEDCLSTWADIVSAGGGDDTLQTVTDRGNTTTNVIAANAGISVDGNTVIDNGAGWHRSYGSTGWYNGTYGGGIYMTDSTWVKTYNSKGFRADGGYQVDGSTAIDSSNRYHYSTNTSTNKWGSVNSSGWGIDALNSGDWDILVYENLTYTSNLMLGYNGSATIKTYNTDETLTISANGLGIVKIDDNVQITGDLQLDGNLVIPGADLAEGFKVDDEVESGDVLIIDTRKEDRLKKSDKAYSSLVAGVVSTKPAIKLGNFNDIQVALSGTVPVKVCDEGGEIIPGDMMTSSSIPGYAMKCADIERCFGSIIGKALESFNEEKGVIKIIVSLQ